MIDSHEPPPGTTTDTSLRSVRIEDLLCRLRARLSRYSLIESLWVIYCHIQYLQFDKRVPEGIEMDPAVVAAVGYGRNYYEWELDLLSRALLQYAPLAGRFSLTRWDEFAGTVNLLKDMDNEISGRMGELLRHNIFLELNRIAFRQFHWQERPNSWLLIRYYKIFGAPALNEILEATIGLTARELYFLGLAYTGHYLHSFDYPYPVDFSAFDITREKLGCFMRHFSKPLSELVKMAPRTELRNEDFAYSKNPLQIFPMVHVGVGGRHRVIAPIPTYLYRRFTAGVYYELTDNSGFGKAFGDAFQAYIGEVLNAALPSEHFTILPEDEYFVGRNRKDTIDWIASDETAHLFVECKTKRMRWFSKIAMADRITLDEDIAKIADAVVQTYKTIEDAKAGHYPNWRPDVRPIYPVVVFLEDSYLFDPSLEKDIDDRIVGQLRAAGIDPVVKTTFPYSISSVADLEILSQVVAQIGIAGVLSKKHEGERTKWNMRSFLLSDFQEHVAKLGKGGLFPDALKSIHPGIMIPDQELDEPRR